MTTHRYQALVVAKALRLYAKTGIKAYSPKAMLATAERITGKKFRRDYIAAAKALEEWAK